MRSLEKRRIEVGNCDHEEITGPFGAVFLSLYIDHRCFPFYSSSPFSHLIFLSFHLLSPSPTVPVVSRPSSQVLYSSLSSLLVINLCSCHIRFVSRPSSQVLYSSLSSLLVINSCSRHIRFVSRPSSQVLYSLLSSLLAINSCSRHISFLFFCACG